MHSKEVVCLAQKKREDGLSIGRIAMDLKLSKSTVEFMLKTNSERKKKRGWKRSIGKRTERRMKRTVTRLLTSGEKVTAWKVKEKCELDVNHRTEQRTLHRIGLKYAKAKKKITLIKKLKGARLECAKWWLTKHVDFKKVIFNDEKHFKFDGPDGWCTWSRRGWACCTEQTTDGRRRSYDLGYDLCKWKYMVGVAERTTEQRKLQTVVGRESPTKDKKTDGKWFRSTARQLQHPCVKTHERMDG